MLWGFDIDDVDCVPGLLQMVEQPLGVSLPRQRAIDDQILPISDSVTLGSREQKVGRFTMDQRGQLERVEAAVLLCRCPQLRRQQLVHGSLVESCFEEVTLEHVGIEFTPTTPIAAVKEPIVSRGLTRPGWSGHHDGRALTDHMRVRGAPLLENLLM